MWLQRDWGDGPKIAACGSCLRLAGLVTVPGGDPVVGSAAGQDRVPGHHVGKVGGAPTYLLTDKPRQSPSSTWPVFRCATRDGCAGLALRLEGGDLRAVRPPLTG